MGRERRADNGPPSPPLRTASAAPGTRRARSSARGSASTASAR
jgi:hypothetical protein